MLNQGDHIPNPFHFSNFTTLLSVWEKDIRGHSVIGSPSESWLTNLLQPCVVLSSVTLRLTS